MKIFSQNATEFFSEELDSPEAKTDNGRGSQMKKFPQPFNLPKMIKVTGLFILIIYLFVLNGCGDLQEKEASKADLPEILERDTLIAITSYSPVSYFIYRGQPMGYEYELLQLLGEHLDLEVEIILAHDLEEMMNMLESGEGDLIAYGLTITSERRKNLSFTEPLNVTRQVLVQRKPDNWRQMKLHEIEDEMIRNPFDLAGKTIHVRKGSAYIQRLKNLSVEIGEQINIAEADAGLTTEDLIRHVASDSIKLTVSDENIAQIHSAYYQDVDIRTPISLPQQTAWATRKASPLLLDTISQWLLEMQDKPDYYVIYNKYFENRQAFRARYASDFNLSAGGSVSPYDSLLREGAAKLNWDWRILAALVYRESQFNPRARSWAGATGLMQLMPRTAREFGASNLNDPVQSIHAGVNFLLWLNNYWSEHIPDTLERQKFVLASYNAGQGHVQDARKLAEHFDADPNIWNGHVAQYMIKKSDPEYYNLDFVTHGYASGIEPVSYVETIYQLYDHYRKFVE